MKRVFALILCITLLMTGCVSQNGESNKQVIEKDPVVGLDLTYNGLDDELLLRQIEDTVYTDTVAAINSEKYVVEDVQAIYISKEYIDEVMFNSQSNVYFGYTLDELNSIFQGTRYVFTLGNDGQTTIQELEEFVDTSTEKIIKNVAIGTGVILVCVVITVVTEGAGAPAAVSAVFAASAKTGAIMAGGSAVFGGVGAGIVRGIETGDMDEALQAAAVSGSEGFKWGAISGAIIGGGKEAFALKAATKSGLTMSEAALIQKEAQLPMDVISQLHSMEEYEIYKTAGLKTFMVNGKTALIQNIDLNYVSELQDGTKVTNLVRMQRGMAPLDPATGKAYQLHHIGQKVDGTLAILTEEQHQRNAAILNIVGKESEIDRNAFSAIRKEFWKYLGNAFAIGGV